MSFGGYDEDCSCEPVQGPLYCVECGAGEDEICATSSGGDAWCGSCWREREAKKKAAREAEAREKEAAATNVEQWIALDRGSL